MGKVLWIQEHQFAFFFFTIIYSKKGSIFQYREKKSLNVWILLKLVQVMISNKSHLLIGYRTLKFDS